MRFEEYLAKQKDDPEYLAAERELKPLLDVANDVLGLRLEKGWSQIELARRMGTQQSNISRVENGLANPTVEFLQRLARALDTELVIRLKTKEEARQVDPERLDIESQHVFFNVYEFQPSSSRMEECRSPFCTNSQESDTRILEVVH